MRWRSLLHFLLFVGSMPSGILAAPTLPIPSDLPEAPFSGGAQQILFAKPMAFVVLPPGRLQVF